MGSSTYLYIKPLSLHNLCHTLYSRTCLERPPHWLQKCGLSRQVVSGDRFSYIEMWVLPNICGLSRQVVSLGSGLPRQISLYTWIYGTACTFMGKHNKIWISHWKINSNCIHTYTWCIRTWTKLWLAGVYSILWYKCTCMPVSCFATQNKCPLHMIQQKHCLQSHLLESCRLLLILNSGWCYKWKAAVLQIQTIVCIIHSISSMLLPHLAERHLNTFEV